MTQFLRSRAQHGDAGNGTGSRMNLAVLVLVRALDGVANELPCEGGILQVPLAYVAAFLVSDRK